jgi:hypothetical protein
MAASLQNLIEEKHNLLEIVNELKGNTRIFVEEEIRNIDFEISVLRKTNAVLIHKIVANSPRLSSVMEDVVV